MRVDLFDYELPEESIAQFPVDPRDSARMMVLDRRTGALEHRHFTDIAEYLTPGDCLVLNDTRVVAARLLGVREATGGRWEGLFLHESDGLWELLTRTRGKLKPGETIVLAGGALRLELVAKTPASTWLARPQSKLGAFELLDAVGHVPLPHYIRSGADRPEDRARYQTVYADAPGAVAAPTAGLHFTQVLLDRLRGAGVGIERVTLHVGPGTFRPVRVDDTAEHRMHSEWRRLTPETARTLRGVRAAGKRTVAVGTTAVRVLESACAPSGALEPVAGATALFLTPPHEFRAVDALITNFHLPRSTLLMLVAAFAGTDAILNAYREAVRSGYRFYSYGDAMLIV